MIYIQDNVLDEESCKFLIQNATIIGTSKVILEKGEKAEDTTYRNSQKFELDAKLASQIHQKIENELSKAQEKIKLSFTNLNLSPIKGLKYKKGHFFKKHNDVANVGPNAKRVLTTIVFLNSEQEASENFEGGKLIIYGIYPKLPKVGFPIEAKPGRLLIFPSQLPHEVTEITEGERYTLVSWFLKG